MSVVQYLSLRHLILLLWNIPFAADILDRVAPKFSELRLDYDCVGGGRIQHDSKNQKIRIYGYSVVSVQTLIGSAFIHVLSPGR